MPEQLHTFPNGRTLLITWGRRTRRELDRLYEQGVCASPIGFPSTAALRKPPPENTESKDRKPRDEDPEATSESHE